MFDEDDKSNQPTDNGGVMQASMPDPIGGTTINPTSAVNSLFGTDSDTPVLPSTALPSATPTITDPVDSQQPDTPSVIPAEIPPILDNTADTSMVVDSPSTDISSDDTDDLVSIKKQALQQLSPLVGQLEQTPEEKFRTTMMMIQASDDKNLIKSAFEAAQSITDDKARAQALLDVINEINYFTQHQANS